MNAPGRLMLLLAEANAARRGVLAISEGDSIGSGIGDLVTGFAARCGGVAGDGCGEPAGFGLPLLDDSCKGALLAMVLTC